MDLQRFADGIDAMASVYSFERLPDGSFGEIRIMAANKGFHGLFALNPQAPEFRPGLPYRLFFNDPNFESFCYKCASTNEPLYSYVNAHGVWLTGLYFPVASDDENTFNCCYILKFTKELETESMSNRSADISSAVLNIGIKLHKSREFESSMSDIIADIRKICGSGHCSIILVDKSDKNCNYLNQNGFSRERFDKIAESMGRTPYEAILAWEAALGGSDCFILDDLSILKERDIRWYESLNSYNIQSIVLYALRFNNELVGFIWSANFDTEKTMKIKETLELSAFFIGSYIANYQLLGRLQQMSMFDMLTGVKNRNAMNKRVDGLMAEGALRGSFGVVFADINGLKTVNDERGHDAGDLLLRKAASLLNAVFGEYEIYRAGGDEFVIFCPGMTEETLRARIDELKKLESSTPEVSFAVGSGLFGSEYDICRAMHEADERMYSDKQEYYRLNPGKKHRGYPSAQV